MRQARTLRIKTHLRVTHTNNPTVRNGWPRSPGVSKPIDAVAFWNSKASWKLISAVGLTLGELSAGKTVPQTNDFSDMPRVILASRPDAIGLG
jgi:hypothetical protein